MEWVMAAYINEVDLSMWFRGKKKLVSSLWNELIYSHLYCVNKSLQADRNGVRSLCAPTLHRLASLIEQGAGRVASPKCNTAAN